MNIPTCFQDDVNFQGRGPWACGVLDQMEEEEFIRAVGAALEPPASGVIVVSLSHMQQEERWNAWSKLNEVHR